MNLRFSAVAVVVLTLVSTLGQPSPAASAPIPGDHPGVSRVVLTDAEGHRSAAAMAGGPDRASEAISTGVVEVDEFLVAGLTWDAGERLGVGTDIRMRVREDRGWSQWLDVEPDAAADRGARAGTEPFVTGGADAVQVVVTGSSADLPAELELNLISPADEGTSTTSSSATSSAASVVDAGSERVLTELISPGTYATYPAGTPLPRIFVHRDVYATACPGSIADAAIINRIYDRVVALGQSAVRLDLTVGSHISGKQKYADLSWAGTTASMDVYRNSVVIATTTTGTTSYTDQVAAKVRTATYQVCETKTTNCSDSVTLTW